MPEIAIILGKASWETIIMVFFSTMFSLIIGLPLGVVLHVTDPAGLIPRKNFHSIASKTVNILRSFPFLILMILVFPLSRLIVDTSIGTKAAIVPLSISAAPFVARIIESALKEVDPEVILAAKVIGSTNMQIIRKVMLPEALPAVVDGITLTMINLIGYSAMAGAIGGGGLGDIAIRYGYHRYQIDKMVGSVIIIIVMVELIQFAGSKLSSNIIAKR